MPLHKPDNTKNDGKDAVATALAAFPPEALNYDTDVTDEVVRRVQAEADAVLAKEEWVVIDGVEKP
jgi:hypothetical protein